MMHKRLFYFWFQLVAVIFASQGNVLELSNVPSLSLNLNRMLSSQLCINKSILSAIN